MQDINKEKLRAFEQKMHDEGADGFADGPRPWETWDESGAQAGNGRHIWEGKARRIYKNTPVRRSLGERILSGLAMIALATMVVGIAGVYLTEEQPQTVAWTAVHPTPIPLPGQFDAAGKQGLPPQAMRSAPVIAELESLPAPAAGITASAPDTPAAGTSASDMPPAASAADPDPEGDTAPPVVATAATGAGEASTWGPAASDTDSETDVEIVTAPAALLLTSPATSSADAGNDVYGMDMDPALAMEIATAPAIDSTPDTAAVAATGTARGSSGTGGSRQVALLPTRDLINRGTTGRAAAGSAVAETATTTAASATATGAGAAAETTAEASGPAQPGATLTEAPATQPAASESTAAAGMAVPENLSPAADSPVAVTDEAADRDAPSAGTSARTVEAPADSDAAAQDMPATTGMESPLGGDTAVTLAEPEPAATPPSPAREAAAPAGDWVVNLASYNHEAMARRMLDKFQAKGVTAEIESATHNDRPIYRIRVTGFASSQEARASIDSLEETLGLKGVWISRR